MIDSSFAAGANVFDDLVGYMNEGWGKPGEAKVEDQGENKLPFQGRKTSAAKDRHQDGKAAS